MRKILNFFRSLFSKFLNLFVTAIFNHFVNAIINYCLPILNSIFNLRFPNLIPEWGIIELIGCFVSLYHIYEIISYCISLKLIIPYLIEQNNERDEKQIRDESSNKIKTENDKNEIYEIFDKHNIKLFKEMFEKSGHLFKSSIISNIINNNFIKVLKNDYSNEQKVKLKHYIKVSCYLIENDYLENNQTLNLSIYLGILCERIFIKNEHPTKILNYFFEFEDNKKFLTNNLWRILDVLFSFNNEYIDIPHQKDSFDVFHSCITDIINIPNIPDNKAFILGATTISKSYYNICMILDYFFKKVGIIQDNQEKKKIESLLNHGIMNIFLMLNSPNDVLNEVDNILYHQKVMISASIIKFFQKQNMKIDNDKYSRIIYHEDKISQMNEIYKVLQDFEKHNKLLNNLPNEHQNKINFLYHIHDPIINPYGLSSIKIEDIVKIFADLDYINQNLIEIGSYL
jgi:hypothetical protein